MRTYTIHTYAVAQYNSCQYLVDISLWQRIPELFFLLLCVAHLWHRTISAYQNLFMLSIVLIIFRHHLSLRYLVILRPHLNLHSQINERQIKFRECLVLFGSPSFVFASGNSNSRKIKTHKTTVLVIVLYGCETWSFSLRKERTTRDVWGQYIEENLWTWEGINSRRLEKIQLRGAPALPY